MTGTVAELHALLPVTFRLRGHPDITIEYVIDTGFTGNLTLPPAAVASMGLPLLYWIPADLADGTTIDVAVHQASIVWHGHETVALVLATGHRPLLGTALLAGSELSAQFVEGGIVHLRPIGP
jgi:clan AA aspartic protease